MHLDPKNFQTISSTDWLFQWSVIKQGFNNTLIQNWFVIGNILSLLWYTTDLEQQNNVLKVLNHTNLVSHDPLPILIPILGMYFNY